MTDSAVALTPELEAQAPLLAEALRLRAQEHRTSLREKRDRLEALLVEALDIPAGTITWHAELEDGKPIAPVAEAGGLLFILEERPMGASRLRYLCVVTRVAENGLRADRVVGDTRGARLLYIADLALRHEAMQNGAALLTHVDVFGPWPDEVSGETSVATTKAVETWSAQDARRVHEHFTVQPGDSSERRLTAQADVRPGAPIRIDATPYPDILLAPEHAGVLGEYLKTHSFATLLEFGDWLLARAEDNRG